MANPMTNPMAQLEQWKKNNAFKNNPQSESHSEPKKEKGKQGQGKVNKEAIRAQKPPYYKLPQMNREFYLMKLSASRCKADFPESFHFKQTFAKECEDFRRRLNGGVRILDTLFKKGLIAKEDHKALYDFCLAASYLGVKLKEVSQHIQKVEAGDAESLNYEQANQLDD